MPGYGVILPFRVDVMVCFVPNQVLVKVYNDQNKKPFRNFGAFGTCVAL